MITKLPSPVAVGRKGGTRKSVVRRLKNEDHLVELSVSTCFDSIHVIVYLCCQLKIFSPLSTDKYLSHGDFFD